MRTRLLAAERALMLVPEAAVNEHDLALGSKDEIGRARQIASAESVPISEPISKAAHEKLRLRVRLANTSHVIRNLLRRSRAHVCSHQ